MPLVWAHAEYVLLLRSLRDNRVFGTPPQTVERYQREKRRSSYAVWRPNHKIRTMRAGQTLRVEVLQPALVRWSPDSWSTGRDAATRETGLGMHSADLTTKGLAAGGRVLFTIYWPGRSAWEGIDYAVEISGA